MATTDDGADISSLEFVTLVSADGFEFVILKEAVMVSPTMKRMLGMDSSMKMKEAATGICHLKAIPGYVLDKVVEYFQYWYKYRDQEDVPDMEIPVELCLEVLDAADFLGLDDHKGFGQ